MLAERRIPDRVLVKYEDDTVIFELFMIVSPAIMPSNGTVPDPVLVLVSVIEQKLKVDGNPSSSKLVIVLEAEVVLIAPEIDRSIEELLIIESSVSK